MKYLFLLLGFLGICATLDAQSLRYLDQKNGIKDFKIGDPFEKWAAHLEPINAKNGVYRYTGDGCKDIFGRTVTDARLVFMAGKVIAINVVTSDIANRDDSGSFVFEYGKYVEDKLVRLFGRPTALDKKGTTEGSRFRYQWATRKLVLQVKVNYGTTADGKVEANFWLVDKKQIGKKKYEGV